MFQPDDSNTIFRLAADLVNHTSRHIFLTGKAGTGKTTFLKFIRENTTKNTVIVAPTGVAAINAGGVTMHSFFQLPRGMFIPGIMKREGLLGFAEVTDRHSLFRNIFFNTNKRELLEELELLIIDEVSMVRCDMLDAVDAVLRHFRKAPHMPFGGVQVVYIGDLFQLPPVVSNEEWNVLQEYYQSPFFFHAKAVEEAQPLYVELKKIYRQNEEDFIALLNKIRNNNLENSDYEFLNRNYKPDFTAPVADHYITVTTHNKKADAINAAELGKLPGKLFSFKADIKDDFSDKSFPTEVELQLKVGAQVMFIKNDSGENRRYFNGKIATVKKIEGEEITVALDDDNDLILEKETWKNIRYIYSKDNDDIDEELLGSFTQYPVRLAWAITVHKSQGLTFEKAIIDAGASFAPGQVYVALSRCTSLQGLILKSRILPYAISTDKRIIEFAQKEIANPNELDQILEEEKYRYWGQALVKNFDWNKLITTLREWLEIIPDKKMPDVKATTQLAQGLLVKAREQSIVAQKFQRQLEQILAVAQSTKDYSQLISRMEKAIGFFAEQIARDILSPIQHHIHSIKYVARINKYREEVNEVESVVWNYMQRLLNAGYGELRFADPKAYEQFVPMSQKTSGSKEPKGSSQKTTQDLFKGGKTIKEIAELRRMAVSTIESHLARFVITGEIEACELVAPQKIENILKVIEQLGPESQGLIKSRLGDDYSYHEIRVVVNHYYYLQKQTA
ncbi:MAG: helix-turn-helix domain-containing protein [Flavisolibacter sp.]